MSGERSHVGGSYNTDVFPECCLQGAASVSGVTEDVCGVRLQSDVQTPELPDA